MRIIKNKLYISFIIFIFLKIFVLFQVNNQRLTPLEIDDAYFYALNGKLFHSNLERQGDLYDSIRDYKKRIVNNVDLISSQYEDKIELHYDLYRFGFLERSLQPRYFLFSSIYGFFLGNENKSIDKVWWYGNYLQSFLISLSMITLLQFFFKNEKYSLKLLSLIFLFFTFIVSKFEILLTPHIVGNALLLIGFFRYLNKNNYKYLNLLLIFFSFHLHSAVFINTIALLFGTILYSFFNTHKKFFKESFQISLLIVIALIIEFVSAKIFNFYFYLNLYQTSYIEQEVLDLKFYENFLINFPILVKDFFRMFGLYSLNNKIVSILFFCIFHIFIFKKLKYLFFLIISFYIILFIFQFKHWEHPNGIFHYVIFVLMIFFTLSIARLYYEIYIFLIQKLNNETLKKIFNVFVIILIGSFLLNKNNIANKIFTKRINKETFQISKNINLDDLESSKSDCLVINDKNSFLYIAYSNYKKNICLTDNFEGSRLFGNNFLQSNKNKKYFFLNTQFEEGPFMIDNLEIPIEKFDKLDIFSFKLN